MPGRPHTQPQIQVAQHAGDQQCNVCHNPHSPKISAATAKVSGDAAAGKQRAAACASCHGANGISTSDTWPNLAGQHAAYLARILAAYKSGDQTDLTMTPMAQVAQQRRCSESGGLFRRLELQVAAPGASGGGDAAAGKALAKNCAACHGETGIASNPAWPKLAGQKPGYLINALKAFRAGLRKDPMMAGVCPGPERHRHRESRCLLRRAELSDHQVREGEIMTQRLQTYAGRAARIPRQARRRGNLRRRDGGRRCALSAAPSGLGKGGSRRGRRRFVPHQGLRLDQAPMGLRRRRDQVHRLPALRRGVQARKRRSRATRTSSAPGSSATSTSRATTQVHIDSQQDPVNIAASGSENDVPIRQPLQGREGGQGVLRAQAVQSLHASGLRAGVPHRRHLPHRGRRGAGRPRPIASAAATACRPAPTARVSSTRKRA